MIKRIVQLPSVIANQIAAGEVIERPASVVKELLENALDAGATLVDIDIHYGGLNQITVSDNGTGILSDDLPLAVSAHATSKITRLDDLYAINSMGFRGEALASIASVARLTISSKPEPQKHAMMLQVVGEQHTVAPCARAVGTTVEVRDLFYNAPVRKRFLKSASLEFQAIDVLVKRFALSAPHVALTLRHEDKMMLTLPAATTEHTKQVRLTKILGRAFVQEAIYLNVEQGAMSISGWLSGKEYQRSQNDRLWVYINQRMVKDKLIHHALKQAYDGLLHPGRFPACLLYFTIKTNEVDVNVHPTKHEVRFQQPRLVHDFFMSHVSRALSAGEPNQHSPNESVTRRDAAQPMSSLEVQKKTIYASAPKEESPWTVLNSEFSLLWIDQQPFLVDVLSVYRSWLHAHIGVTFPLDNRPLLVAVSYPLSAHLKARLGELQPVLRVMGINVEAMGDELRVRSIPVAVPYLNLHQFLTGLEWLTHYEEDEVFLWLLQSQTIDVTHLSSDERLELSHYVMQGYKQSSSLACKQLTAEDCRALLYV